MYFVLIGQIPAARAGEKHILPLFGFRFVPECVQFLE